MSFKVSLVEGRKRYLVVIMYNLTGEFQLSPGILDQDLYPD